MLNCSHETTSQLEHEIRLAHMDKDNGSRCVLPVQRELSIQVGNVMAVRNKKGDVDLDSCGDSFSSCIDCESRDTAQYAAYSFGLIGSQWQEEHHNRVLGSIIEHNR